jgi:uncharacterized protein YkvS
MHEDMPCITGQRRQVQPVAGVGERVEVDDGLGGRVCEPVEHEVAADEAGAAGDEEGHFLP